MEPKTIQVQTVVEIPLSRVWSMWNDPESIMSWAYTSDDWYVPYAENDLSIDGKFLIRMAAKNNSFSFDFKGHYTAIEENKSISYMIEDGRKVNVNFIDTENGVLILETFEPESENEEEVQQKGWQAILDNFKKYAESIA